MFTLLADWSSPAAWQPWLIPLADAAAKGLVLMLAVVLLAAASRRASAARRHLVWSLGMAGLLVLPLLSAALPAWRVPFLPHWLAKVEPAEAEKANAAVKVPGNVPTSRLESMSSHQTMDGLAGEAGASAALNSPFKTSAVENPEMVTMTSAPADPRAGSGWLLWLVPVWLTGTLTCLIAPLTGLWQLERLKKGATRVLDGRWTELLDGLRTTLKIRREVRILRSAGASMPLTFGVWRPVLVIPAEADGWSPERRRLVLLHELAHVRRLDWLTQMLAHAACAVHWFNPLAWLAARRMHVEREQASDDLVLSCGAKASDYARELLAIAANYQDRPLMALAAVPMARHSALESRLRAVLDGGKNRTALTAMTSLVALLLLAMVLVPLAMLQAGEPVPKADTTSRETVKPTVTQAAPAVPAVEEPKVEPRNATPEELAARKKGIHLSVMNAKRDRPIPEFRVLAGVRSSVSQEFEKRTGSDVVVWQPHTLRLGKDGDFIWPLERAYDEMAIRVEADGLVPQTSAWIKKSDGPKHLVFMLAEDPGIKGRVLQPDGKPAAGATIALGLVQRDIRLENGRIWGSDKPRPDHPSDRWRLPTIVKTDAEGRFQLPTETSVAAVLVVHDSGVRELAYSDFKKSPELTLQGWGRVEGRVLWKDKPGVDEPVTLGTHRDDYGYPGMVASYASGRSDADGQFTFDKLLPGLAQLSRPISLSDKPDSNQAILNGMFSHLQIKAGEPTKVMLGGQGRTVTGKFTGSDSWDKATFHVHPTAPHFGFGGDNEMWVAFDKFKRSPIGPLFFRDNLKVNADGTFKIDNVLPGRYQLFLTVEGGRANTQFQIDPEVPGQNPPVLDVGAIAVQKTTVQASAAEPVKVDKKAESSAELQEFLSRLNAVKRGPFGGDPIAMNEQGEIVGLQLAEFELKAGDARIIGQLTHLTWLSLQRSNVKDDDLRQWSGLKALKKLNLWDAKVTDNGIAALAGLSSLQSLQLGGTGLTDAGMTSVGKLTALRELDVARSKVTDEGLKALTPLKELEGLKLSETSVSDAGLKTLEGFPKLRGVTLDETAVTAAGIEALSKREGFGWMATPEGVAKELAQRMTAGDLAGVEAMLSIALNLPSQGKFKTRTVTAIPATDRDKERQRQRFRIEWDWNNNGKEEGLFAEIGVRQATVRVMEAGVLEAKPKPAAKTVSLRGRVIDAETGKAVPTLLIQGGMFDPANPGKVSWGYSESRSSATDGSFSTTIQWANGWTARIVADGYLPYPLMEKAPPDDKTEIELVVRLKRGRSVRGTVLDHEGKPLKGAAVFALGPGGLNLAAGQAWSTWGEADPVPRPTFTDEAGRFELAAGDAKSMAVSCKVMDVWPAVIPEKGEVTIRLPAPGRIDVLLDIEGAAEESRVFYQRLGPQPGFERLQSMRELKISNGGKLTLDALPPGKYQICRHVMNRLTDIGFGAMLDRQFVEIKAGEAREIDMVREKGGRIRGKVSWPEGKQLQGVIVSVSAEKAEKQADSHEWQTEFSSQVATEDGSYLTERIPPGRYLLRAKGYSPLTPEQRVRSGILGPAVQAELQIEVLETGEITAPELKLQ